MNLPALFRPSGSSHAGFRDVPPPLTMPCSATPEEIAHTEAELAWVPLSSPYREYLLAKLAAGQSGGAL